MQVNIEQNTPLRVVDGFLRQTFQLKPGQRGDIVYRVAPNTRQVIVSVSSFQAGPASQQDQLVGDTLTFGIHLAQTTDHTSAATYVSRSSIFGPEPGS